MSVRIEKLTEKHIDGLEIIENTCFSEPWSRKSLEDLLNCDYAVYFVAVDEETNAVAGYCGMYVSFDTGNINNIGVLPQFRRCGIGASLLDKLCEYCTKSDITLLTLEVRQSNAPAIGLYEKFGFEMVGVRKNYYKKPTENGLLFNKEIKSYS